MKKSLMRNQTKATLLVFYEMLHQAEKVIQPEALFGTLTHIHV